MFEKLSKREKWFLFIGIASLVALVAALFILEVPDDEGFLTDNPLEVLDIPDGIECTGSGNRSTDYWTVDMFNVTYYNVNKSLHGMGCDSICELYQILADAHDPISKVTCIHKNGYKLSDMPTVHNCESCN